MDSNPYDTSLCSGSIAKSLASASDLAWTLLYLRYLINAGFDLPSCLTSASDSDSSVLMILN